MSVSLNDETIIDTKYNSVFSSLDFFDQSQVFFTANRFGFIRPGR